VGNDLRSTGSPAVLPAQIPRASRPVGRSERLPDSTDGPRPGRESSTQTGRGGTIQTAPIVV